MTDAPKGDVFSLARWFAMPEDASSKEDDEVREEILSDLYRATAVGCHEGTILVSTPTGACMIETETDPEYPDPLVWFDYCRNDRWTRTRFWMNASSVKGLGDFLRTVERKPFDQLFVGAVR